MDSRVLQTQKWLNETYGNISGFPTVDEDGITGHSTFKALIYALQIEIGISNPDGVFGNDTLSKCPTLSESSNPNEETPSNIIYILQGSLWCKGISPGGFTGVFGPATANAIYKFQVAAGIERDKIVYPYILQGIMNTDGYTFRSTDDIYDTYRHEVQMGLNKYYGSKIGLIAPNGVWERKSHKNLIKAIQIEWGAVVDGSFGSGTLSKAPTLSIKTNGYTNSKRLLQWCLAINGFYSGSLEGTFGTDTYNSLYAFQEFVCLGADGICGKQTWASLITSCGYSRRSATALDTSKKISEENAAAIKNAGYTDIGRYLTNTPNGTFDKAMTQNELNILKSAGLNVFPIFQTRGNKASYFTAYQGISDANTAKKAAQAFGFPPSATIYFCVDYDVLMADIENNIIPYFQNIKEQIGSSYKIGAYGPRYICTKLANMHLTTSSFVCDMSTGFTCNIGQKMPLNWAYDQFTEIHVADSAFSGVDYDKCIASPRKTATAPSDFISYTPEELPGLSSDSLEIFENLYNLAYEYLESLSGPTTGVYPSVLGANKIVLAYLRQPKYVGTSWSAIAGPVEEPFNSLLAERYPEINIDDIYLNDPVTNRQIEIKHFAVTLGSLITYVAVIDTYLDPLTDAFAGWAGDLMQVGGTIGESMSMGGTNYFLKPSVLYTAIGSMEGELDDCKFWFKKDGNILYKTEAGFDYVDLVQDIDAYNISKLYSLNTLPLHTALDKYYNVDGHAVKRYSIFEKYLLEEFNSSSLYEVAKKFTCLEGLTVKAMNLFFASKFGSFDNSEYGEVLATAFADKLAYLKSQETDDSGNSSGGDNNNDNQEKGYDNSRYTYEEVLSGTGYYMQDTQLRFSQGVKTMQEKLNTAGYNCGTPDGRFGSGTDNAVKNFQTAHNLTPNGIADGATLTALDTAASGGDTGEETGGDFSIYFDSINKRFDTNQQVVYEHLLNAGLSKIAIAAFMGNIQVENSFSTAWSGDQGSVGLCQWREERKDNLVDYANSISGSSVDINVQAAFILEECSSSSTFKDGDAVKCLNMLKDPGLSDINEAADIVTALYERCYFQSSWSDVETACANTSWLNLDRFSQVPNAYNNRYYIDTPDRRGYSKSYYDCLLKI